MKKYITFLFLLFQIVSHAQTFETVFEDSTYQLTGVAVSNTGRIFTNYPRWSSVYKYALVEVSKNDQVKPFPNAEWNNWDVEKGGDKMHHFLCVQSVVIDDNNTMWVVDAGYGQNATGNDKGQKLVKINLQTNKVEHIYPLATVTSAKSYANDVRIDTKKQIAYLTNSGEGGIIVINLKNGATKQVLLANKVTVADTSYIMHRNGAALYSNGKPFFVNSDGIALTANGEYLYFKSLTDNNLYRIATSYLNDNNITKNNLASKVEFLGKFTTTDGMILDKKGNLYLGDLEKRSIICVAPDLSIKEILAPNETMAWPDSYHITNDGWLYISCSRIDDEARFHNGKSERNGPYKIIRTKIN